MMRTTGALMLVALLAAGCAGSGDPADAPEWLQDRLALKLYRQSGTSPWPNCGG